MKLTATVAAVAITLALAPSPALAAGAPLPAPSKPELRYSLVVDLPVLGASAALFLAGTLLQKQLAAPECRWCASNALDDWARDALRWSNPGGASAMSNLTAYGLAPLWALGLTAFVTHHDGRARNAPVDALLIAEATALAMNVNQIFKLTIGRERPFVHDLSTAGKARTFSPADNNTSFFSGHTTFTFALAVSSGTVASMRGYRLAPLVWAGGLTLAAATGYFRLAADKHYLTDVLTGAAVGSLVGFAVPFLFHRPVSKLAGSSWTPAILPVRGGMLLTVASSP